MKSVKSALLIDDDKFTNFYNNKVVKKHTNFNAIASVNSGADGLKYLKKAIEGNVETPDIIFLDINMPAMNGWEFLEAFNELDPEFTATIKVIMLTTSSNPKDREKANKSDIITNYINKPLSLDVLNEVLNHLVPN